MTDAASRCRRFHVSGKVQGVYFRASARQIALGLGLRGWTCNLRDGRVLVVARGPERALNEFAAWLALGPPAARVDALASAVIALATPDSFEIR